jgi:hypothetical protein
MMVETLGEILNGNGITTALGRLGGYHGSLTAVVLNGGYPGRLGGYPHFTRTAVALNDWKVIGINASRWNLHG